MILRTYQQTAVESITAAFGQHKSVLFCLPCRGGKTAIVGRIISEHIAGGGRVMFIAHRNELVVQATVMLGRNGIEHEIVASKETIRQCGQAQFREFGHSLIRAEARCSVASIDTLARGEPHTETTLWCIDEAHHITAENKWGRLASKLPNSLGLGVTATPIRLDNKPIGNFSCVIHGASHNELQSQGYLAPFTLHVPEKQPLGISGEVVATYKRLASNKQAIAYCSSIEHADIIGREFNAAGIACEAVSSRSTAAEREAAVSGFKSGRLTVLANVDLFGEGIDVPSLEVCIMLRPTTSFGLFYQQLCRPLNPNNGTKHAIIIDHVGNASAHADMWHRCVVRGDWPVGDATTVMKSKTCGHCGCAIIEYPCGVCGGVKQDYTTIGKGRGVLHVDEAAKLVESTLLFSGPSPPTYNEYLKWKMK